MAQLYIKLDCRVSPFETFTTVHGSCPRPSFQFVILSSLVALLKNMRRNDCDSLTHDKALETKFYCSENNECNYYEIVPLKQKFLIQNTALITGYREYT